ncbi:MAG TPA: hypothetical protein VM344_11055 [Vitreimonas sp.]|nr:hypothetical protein [Vitreimonas sp.]
MHEREPTIMKDLLERLLATRARRDCEARFSEPWQAADAEMHAIERQIFRVPFDTILDAGEDQPTAERAPTRLQDHVHSPYRSQRAG